MNTPRIINKNLRRRVALSFGAALLLASSSGLAQEEGEDIFELSPFTVSADDQSGYRATSTLAGTRIKTDLKDLGASISVVTEQFMEDTGATSLEDLFQYTTGTEIGGLDGNYSASSFGEGKGSLNTDSSRAEPQQGGRVRGLARPNYTRNYFSTSIPIDRYNTSAITISRGPNSLLFGLGSAGGVVDAGLGMAGIGNDKSKVQFRIDEHGTQRTQLDFNRTLIEDRLAVKVSSVYEDKNYKQEEASKLSKRFYGSFNAVLRKGNDGIFGKTSLRGNVELGSESMTPPDVLPPLLAWEPFFQLPPDFRDHSGIDYRMGYDTLVAGFEKWKTLDTRRQFDDEGKIIVTWKENESPIYASSHIFTQLATVYNGKDGEGPMVLDEASGITGFQGWLHKNNFVKDQFSDPADAGFFTNPFINTRSYTEGNGASGFYANTLSDTNVFDYENHLITGSLQQIDKRFDSEGINFEQIMFGGKGGFEISMGREFYQMDRYQPFGASRRDRPVYIDVTEYLSDDIPNPNVGRAFMINRTNDQKRMNSTQRENMRATAFYTLDFEEMSDGWTKHLGKHSFTGLFQEEDYTNKGLTTKMFIHGLGAVNLRRDMQGQKKPVQWENLTGDTPAQFVYISDDLRGVELEDVRLYPMNIKPLRDGDVVTQTYFDATDDTYKEGNFRMARLAAKNGASINRTVVSSKAFAWQSYFLDRHIVGLAGWRTDDIQDYERMYNQPSTGSANILDMDRAFVLEENPKLHNEGTPEESDTRSGDTFTWSVVGHAPQKWIDNVPFFSSVSAHYGISENFSAIELRNDIENNPISNPSGETTEYGISLGFAEEKWHLKLTKFETSEAFANVQGDQTSSVMNELERGLNNYQGDFNGGGDFTTTVAYRDHGIQSYDDMFNRILSLEPAHLAAITQRFVNEDTGDWDQVDRIENARSTTDRKAEGYEMELVGNPTKNWRIAFNFAQIETINDNSATLNYQYALQYMDSLEESGLWFVPDGPGSVVPFWQRFANGPLKNILTQRSKDGAVSQEQRKYRANFITNYSFREGGLKGFSVGGAIRYQDKVATGYATEVNEANLVVPIIDQPYYGPDSINGDMWFSYSKKFDSGIDWKIQLNIKNLIGDQDLIPVTTNPDGTHAAYRMASEKSWFLTNTFSF